MQSSQQQQQQNHHHHHHRHRAASPQRRGTNERVSTGALDTRPASSYYSGASSFSSLPSGPRASTDRVIPISEKKYVNGQLVSSRSNFSDGAYDSTYAPRHRGSTLENGTRYGSQASSTGSNHSANTHKGAVVHNEARAPSPATKPSKYEEYYVTPNTSARQHKKTYSVDQQAGAVRIDQKDASRLVDLNRAAIALDARGDRRGYHLSGTAPKRADDYGAFEYTTPRDMYETTQPARHRSRTRRGSVDAVSRERPISMYESVPAPRAGPDRERGPPVTTRGFDKINNGVTRHNSLQIANRSPQRHRDHAGSFSESEDFSPAQRMPGYRDPYLVGAELPLDDRRSSRPTSRWFEDTGLADRGFGIRATSVDASRRDPSIDRRAYGGDMPPEHLYRDHTTGSSHAPPRQDRRDVGRHNERDVRSVEKEYLRDRDQPKGRENRESYDRRRDRDYDDRRFEENQRRDKRDSRDVRERDNREYEYDRRDRNDRNDRRETRDNRDESHGGSFKPLLGAALAGGAGLYAATKGRRDESRDDRSRDSKKDDDRSRDRRDRPEERPEKPRERRERNEERSRRSPPQDKEERERERERERQPERERERQREQMPPSDDDAPKMIEAPRSEASIKDIIGDKQQGEKELQRAERRPSPKQDQLYAEGERAPHAERRATESDRRRGEPERGSNERRSYEDDRRRHDDHEKSTAESETKKKQAENGDTVPARPEANKPRIRRGSTDEDPPRQRHYVTKDTGNDSTAVARIDNASSDPDADYRRRVEAELARVRSQPAARDEHKGSDSDREKYRSDRDGRPRTVEDKDANRRVEGLGAHENRNIENGQMFDRPMVDEPSDVSDSSSKGDRKVAIVEPAKEEKLPKSILRKPTEKFPEDPNPIREGVAPLKDAKSSKGVPPGARWTKIDRRLVNPESLEEAKERYEERQDHVIVLRVLSKDEIQKFADRTKQIRDERHERDRDREHRRRHDD